MSNFEGNYEKKFEYNNETMPPLSSNKLENFSESYLKEFQDKNSMVVQFVFTENEK